MPVRAYAGRYITGEWLPALSAPRPRLERGTHCLGVHFMVNADLDVSSSEAVWSAFE